MFYFSALHDVKIPGTDGRTHCTLSSVLPKSTARIPRVPHTFSSRVRQPHNCDVESTAKIFKKGGAEYGHPSLISAPLWKILADYLEEEILRTLLCSLSSYLLLCSCVTTNLVASHNVRASYHHLCGHSLAGFSAGPQSSFRPGLASPL